MPCPRECTVLSEEAKRLQPHMPMPLLKMFAVRSFVFPTPSVLVFPAEYTGVQVFNKCWLNSSMSVCVVQDRKDCVAVIAVLSGRATSEPAQEDMPGSTGAAGRLPKML